MSNSQAPMEQNFVSRVGEVSEPRQCSPLRVLVVDDDRDNADSLTALLKADGHAAEAVYDAPSALDGARRKPPLLVFLDAAMPRVDGFSLAPQLRQLPGMADAVLVCLTGYGDAKHRAASWEAGCTHFLLKPASLEEVLQIAQQVAEKSGGTRQQD